MDQIVAILKGDFDTIRDLERKGFRLFYLSGIVALVGFVLTLTQILMIIGLPLLVLGMVVLIIAMLWMSKLSKMPVRNIYCPYCASKNDVFMSRREFSCDICSRRIAISPNGEPIPIEPDDEDDD